MSQREFDFELAELNRPCTCGPNCDDICTGTYCGCKACQWSCEEFDQPDEPVAELLPCPYCGDPARVNCRSKGCGSISGDCMPNTTWPELMGILHRWPPSREMRSK